MQNTAAAVASVFFTGVGTLDGCRGYRWRQGTDRTDHPHASTGFFLDSLPHASREQRPASSTAPPQPKKRRAKTNAGGREIKARSKYRMYASTGTNDERDVLCFCKHVLFLDKSSAILPSTHDARHVASSRKRFRNTYVWHTWAPAAQLGSQNTGTRLSVAVPLNLRCNFRVDPITRSAAVHIAHLSSTNISQDYPSVTWIFPRRRHKTCVRVCMLYRCRSMLSLVAG